jgi:predicted GNAT family N-acyltransferase
MLTIAPARSAAELDQALAIRRAVFIKEQRVSEAEEMDGQDAAADHYLTRLDGEPVATARVRHLEGGRLAKIERVAVLRAARGRGIGRLLMLRILDDLALRGVPAVKLNAQLAVTEFYVRLGFVPRGEVFLEANIPHVEMHRPIMPAGATARP